MLPGRTRGDVPPPVHGTGTDDTGYASLCSRSCGLVPHTGVPSVDMARCGKSCCNRHDTP